MGKNQKKRRVERENTAGKAAAPSKESSDWVRAKGPALRFVLISGGLMLLFYGVFYTSPEDSPRLNAFLRTYLGFYASASGFVLSLFGAEVMVHGPTLFVGGKAVEVARGCDAMEPIALFVAALIAVQVRLRSKLWGLLVCVPLLVFLNLLRIIALSWISLAYPEWFETAHVTVGQTLFVVCTLCLWFVWVMRATREEKQPRAVAAD